MLSLAHWLVDEGSMRRGDGKSGRQAWLKAEGEGGKEGGRERVILASLLLFSYLCSSSFL